MKIEDSLFSLQANKSLVNFLDSQTKVAPNLSLARPSPPGTHGNSGGDLSACVCKM